MADFFFTDNILNRLNEDLFTRSSDTFDAGIEKSALVKAWGQGFNISDILSRIFGDSKEHKLEDIKLRSLDYLDSLDDSDYLNQVLYSSVRTIPVQLPHILIMNKNQEAPTQENTVWNWNYTPLFETYLGEASLHRLGKGYYQAMDSSHRVFFMRKGHLATVESNKNVGAFIQNARSTTGHGPIHSYVLNSLDEITQHVKSDIASKLNALDSEFVNALLSKRLPLPLQNAVALGLLDVANLNIQTTGKTYTSTSGSMANMIFNNKISLIKSNQKVHPDGYSVDLNQAVVNDIDNKINATTNLAANVYRQDKSLQLFLDSYELGKKNPHSTYRKVYKMNLTVFNWIINDLNTKVFKSSAKDSSLYFSQPDYKTIEAEVGGSAKKDSMPFVVIKAMANKAGFPVQFRCFATECSKSKDASYNGIPGVTKVCVITPGFNSYITNKAKEESGNSDISSYIKELNQITPSESSAHMSFTEGAKVMWKALERCYSGEGKFESKTLFKHVPGLLSQAEVHGIDIMTSLKDLSTSKPDYVDKIPSNKLKQYSIAKVATQAAYLLANPIKPGHEEVPSPEVDAFSPRALKIQSDFITSNNFMTLSQIREFFIAKLDDVQSLNDLQELSSIFSNVLRNLSRGFWTAKGNFGLAPMLHEGKSLGLFNILLDDKASSDEDTMDVGDIGGRLNLRSLGLVQSKNPDTGELESRDTQDDRVFIDAKYKAIEMASSSVVQLIGS